MANILLVDDENELRETLAMFFELNNFNVLHAESVDQAMCVFKDNPIDLIITDFRMPLKTGEDLLREVKEVAPDQDVIILTGHADTPRDALINQGALDLLFKPIGGKELVQIAEKAINSKNGQTEKRKILMLEDNAVLLETYHDIFTLKGFEVSPTSNKEEAKKLIENQSFNTLICDYYLGKETSASFIQEFVKKFPGSLVILLSGENIPEETYKKLHTKAEKIHFMLKPFSVQELIDLLGN